MPWDPADHLQDVGAIAAYLNAALEDGDPALVSAALGDVARASGMSELARALGVSRASLYKTLSADGRPQFGTIVRLMEALGMRLSVVPVEKSPNPHSSAA